MKFLWLDINASYSHSSMALPALEAQIPPHISEAVEWKVVSGTIKSNREQLLSQIEEFSPDYIFATGWLFNIEYLLSVLRRASALLDNLHIVLGGPEFLGDNREFLINNTFVTAVFKGDGEEVFGKMTEMLVNGADTLEWLNLPGFEYIDRQSGINYYKEKECVKTLDFCSLNAPETSRFFNWEKAFVQIETSRGCFNSCRFCVSGIDTSEVIDLPVEKIRSRLDFIASKGIREIRVLDRTFNANSSRAVALISLFEEFAGRLKFHIEVHPTMINEHLKKRLVSVPCDLLHIEAGIQSLNDDVIGSCRRKGNCKSSLDGLKFLLSTGKFEVHTDFIAGLPGYSYNNLVEDIRTMIRINPHEIQLELLKLLPGTYFRANAKMLGIKYSPEPPYEVLQTPSIGFGELRKSMVLSKIIEYWYNDPSWRELFARIVLDEPQFLHAFTDYLFTGTFMEHTHSYESKSLILYSFCKENFPEYLDIISIRWIANGLSIKKEPASKLSMWHFGDSVIENPVLDVNNNYNSYYYFDNENIRYWFVYDRSVDRHKPVIFYKEIIHNS